MADSRILVAVSSPWASDKLFETLRDLADRLNASVIVAHVAKATEQDESDEEPRMRGQQTLETLTNRLADANIPAEGLLLYGADTGRAILNAADAHHATLIILGLSAKSRLTRLLAGDIPQQVIKHASIPVLLYPPEWTGTI